MTTNLLSVIEQLVDALDHCRGAITERGLNGSPDQAEKWGLQLPLERAYAALAAGQQALEQTQVEAEPEWNDENVIAYCIARGISAAKAFTTGATQPKVEPAPKRCGLCGDCDAKAQKACTVPACFARDDYKPAPSTAGERDTHARFKAKHQFLELNRAQPEPLVKIAYEYGVFDKAVSLYYSLLQSTADHIPDAGKMGDTQKIGCVQHDCAECQARAAMPVGELTLEQITRIYDRYGGDMVNCTRAIERELAAARSQPVREPLLWLPIESAPEGLLVAVGWIDKEDGTAHYDFDYLEDGVWQRYFDYYEHLVIAGAPGRAEDAPYTYWMDIAHLPAAHGIK